MTYQSSASTLLANLEGCHKDIPRYLYRVYAPDSNGSNSAASFASAAASGKEGYEQLSEISLEKAKNILDYHFRWLYFHGDAFVSWTSSLLYALQFAVRKTRNKKNPPLVSEECDIKLCVLDTVAIDTSSFLRASDLLRVCNIQSDSRLKHEYHTTEYLLHGALDVKEHSRTVSLSNLCEEGLFDLMPELDDEEYKSLLWLRVDRLRNTMVTTLTPMSGKDVALALWIASLFGGAWIMPVMVALLSLRRRDPNDERFLRVLREFADPARDFLTLHADRGFDPVDAPELANFANMMKAGFHAVRRIKDGEEVDGLEAAVDGLGLGSDATSKEDNHRSADDEVN